MADRSNAEWLDELSADGPAREAAVADLHGLLLRAAHHELARRGASDRDDLALQSADDALMALLAKLDSFRGESRFTTWAYKFAVLEAAVRMRRLAWRDREVPLVEEAWATTAASPEADAEMRELIDALRAAIEDQLSPRQREVLVAVTISGVPIDVLAERLGSTRGALYKTLHDARQKLRRCLADQGYDLGAWT